MQHVGSGARGLGSDGTGPLSRGALYEFLSYAFTRNPDSDVIELLGSETLSARLMSLEGTLGEEDDVHGLGKSLEKLVLMLPSFRGMGADAVERLQEDHARLFRGIKRGYGPPPPYESVYRSDIVMSGHASDVQRLYRKEGLDVRGGEPPDSIGLELGFMAHLCKKQGESLEEGNLESADRYASLQEEFLSGHVQVWVPRFCTEVLRYDSAFYGALAELTMGLLSLESRKMKKRKPHK